MWKYFIAGLVLGGLTIGLSIRPPVNRVDQKVTEENTHLHALRVSILSRLLVETCFLEEFDPEFLTARLEPVGYLRIGGTELSSVHFGGGLGGRILFSKSESSQFCSASLDAASNPDLSDLCETAIQFHRRLHVNLRLAKLKEPSNSYNLENAEGFESTQSYDEVCVASAEDFSWYVGHRDALFDVKLDSVTRIKAPKLSYAGYSRGAGYRFSISRRLSR